MGPKVITNGHFFLDPAFSVAFHGTAEERVRFLAALIWELLSQTVIGDLEGVPELLS